MPFWGSGEGMGSAPGAWRTLAAAHSPRCPAGVPRLELEPGLNLSTLGSCPDTLPRGLGHSVPVPPAAGSPRLPGQHPLWPTDHPIQRQRLPPDAQPCQGGGPPHPQIRALGGPEAATPLWTLWFGGLASPSPFGPARQAAGPDPCPAGHIGVPRGLRAWLPLVREPGSEIATVSRVDGCLPRWQRPPPGLFPLLEPPWGAGSPNAIRTPAG